MPAALSALILLAALLLPTPAGAVDGCCAWRLESTGRAVVCGSGGKTCTVEIRRAGSATLLGAAQTPDKVTGTYNIDGIMSGGSGSYCVRVQTSDGTWNREHCRPYWVP